MCLGHWSRVGPGHVGGFRQTLAVFILVSKKMSEAKANSVQREPIDLYQATAWCFRSASNARSGLVCCPMSLARRHAVLVQLGESNSPQHTRGSATSAQKGRPGQEIGPAAANSAQLEDMPMKRAWPSARSARCGHRSRMLAKLRAFATWDLFRSKAPPIPPPQLRSACLVRMSCQGVPRPNYSGPGPWGFYTYIYLFIYLYGLYIQNACTDSINQSVQKNK